LAHQPVARATGNALVVGPGVAKGEKLGIRLDRWHASADYEGGLSATLPKLWIYTSADTDLSGTYFSDDCSRGIRVNDMVLGVDATTSPVNLCAAAVGAVDPAHPYAVGSATLAKGVKIGN
jgi:hypothetical protein